MADGVLTLFRVNGRLVAIDDTCIRCSASLASGHRRASKVTCRGCGWCYDLLSGEVSGVPQLRTATYEVRIERTRFRAVEGLP